VIWSPSVSSRQSTNQKASRLAALPELSHGESARQPELNLANKILSFSKSINL
jgi:hypothetical protein